MTDTHEVVKAILSVCRQTTLNALPVGAIPSYCLLSHKAPAHVAFNTQALRTSIAPVSALSYSCIFGTFLWKESNGAGIGISAKETVISVIALVGSDYACAHASPPPPRAFIYLKEKRNLFLWYPLNDIYLNGMKRHLHSVDKWTRHFDICIITFHRIFIIIINVLLFSSVERVQMSHYHLNANLRCSLLRKSFLSSFRKKFL